MLSIHIIAVGKDKDSWITDQSEHFTKLISKYARLDITTIPEEKYTKTTDIKKAIESEASTILSRHRGGLLVALDVKGESYSTEQLADKLRRIQVGRHSTIEFAIGGPHGLGASLLKIADLRMSLSPLTLSHQIVRLVLLEQLYRVLNLNAGGSYHK
ncbi:MAG: 23S rRNA (pseudouridine(1915)-N(3))-methyltransferase RlmH [Candidatus Zixiibacteriota bacterium]